MERLFLKINNNNSNKKENIKLSSEMLNLLGCSKDNFLKLIEKMNYKTYKKENEIYFKYSPQKNKERKNFRKNTKNDNPFSILKEINFN